MAYCCTHRTEHCLTLITETSCIKVMFKQRSTAGQYSESDRLWSTRSILNGCLLSLCSEESCSSRPDCQHQEVWEDAVPRISEFAPQSLSLLTISILIEMNFFSVFHSLLTVDLSNEIVTKLCTQHLHIEESIPWKPQLL